MEDNAALAHQRQIEIFKAAVQIYNGISNAAYSTADRMTKAVNTAIELWVRVEDEV